MATVKRVVILQNEGRGAKAGTWGWFHTDGRVTLAGGRVGYGRKSDAVRGAKRANGVNVKILFGLK